MLLLTASLQPIKEILGPCFPLCFPALANTGSHAPVPPVLFCVFVGTNCVHPYAPLCSRQHRIVYDPQTDKMHGMLGLPVSGKLAVHLRYVVERRLRLPASGELLDSMRALGFLMLKLSLAHVHMLCLYAVCVMAFCSGCL